MAETNARDRHRRRPGRPGWPRIFGVRRADVIAVVAFNGLLIVGMWGRHGGLDALGSMSADLTAGGELTALLGTYAALVQIVLMSRAPWLERSFGMDRLAHWHRWLGFSTVTLIGAHVVLSTIGYALGDGKSVAAETVTLLTTYPYVLMATAAMGLLLLVMVTSHRRSRRRLKYETWHFVHLYAYLAVALAFGHELAVGTDFSSDGVARAYWMSLYIVVLVCVVGFRFALPILLTVRHRLRIARVVPEGAGIASIYLTGRNLERLPARAGQYFIWRFLARDGWWRAHPFSLSAAPNGRFLRITVKNVGDGTGTVHRLPVGTRVALEGPYGIFTTALRRQPRVLLLAAGIGITPIRALLEDFPVARDATMLIYRARSSDDLIFREELEQISTNRQVRLHIAVGRRGAPDSAPDPFSRQNLLTRVPDVVHRDVFICGPAMMMAEVSTTLRSLGVPNRQIHYERFALL